MAVIVTRGKARAAWLPGLASVCARARDMARRALACAAAAVMIGAVGAALLQLAAEIVSFLRQVPRDTIVLLDEAYIEFVAPEHRIDVAELTERFPNVVVVRTFSKAYGLAGLRIGFGYCPVDVIAGIDRIRLPLNANLPAQYAAVAALSDAVHIEASRQQILNWHPRLRQAISGLGFEIRKSIGNFVLIYFRDAAEAARANEFLMSQGIIIRHVANYGLPQCLRITIGKDEENQAVIEALGKFAATR